MARILIRETTAAATSLEFTVYIGNSPRGLKCWGLSGSEQMTLQYDPGNGVFADVGGDAGFLSATEPKLSILATGTYRLTKPATASASGASID